MLRCWTLKEVRKALQMVSPPLTQPEEFSCRDDELQFRDYSITTAQFNKILLEDKLWVTAQNSLDQKLNPKLFQQETIRYCERVNFSALNIKPNLFSLATYFVETGTNCTECIIVLR